MAVINKFLEDMDIISKLGDNPGADNGLSSRDLRAKFDEGGKKIQQYLNNVIVPGISEPGVLFAPAGYGLGGETKDIGSASVDDISGTGWYWGYNGLPDGFGYSLIQHIERNANYATQIAYSLTNVSNWGAICFHREKTGGEWKPWEWENPPMIPGVEYRTTERYNGIPVYVKRIEHTASGLSAASMTDYKINHYIENILNVVRYNAVCGGYNLPEITENNGLIGTTHVPYITSTQITLRMINASWNGTFVFTIYYTKYE